MSNKEEIDLFNNPAMKQQFDALPQEEKDAYRKAGEYMYAKDYTSESSAVDDAIQYIRLAFNAGMMPSQLTNEELEFLRNVYGAEWYKEFDFPSETYSGIEKKTSRNKRTPARPAPIKMPVVKPKPLQTVIEDNFDEDENTDEEDIPPEELEINRQISYVYDVWS